MGSIVGLVEWLCVVVVWSYVWLIFVWGVGELSMV